MFYAVNIIYPTISHRQRFYILPIFIIKNNDKINTSIHTSFYASTFTSITSQKVVFLCVYKSNISLKWVGQSVQSLSLVFGIPWMAECQASLSVTNSQSLLKLMSVESVMPSNHLILCVPFSSCLQSFPASGSFLMSQSFTSGGQSIGVSASVSGPSNEYSGLISFRIDWLDLLAVQRTLKSLL